MSIEERESGQKIWKLSLDVSHLVQKPGFVPPPLPPGLGGRRN